MATYLRRFSSLVTLSAFLFATFFPSLTPVFAAAGDPVDIAIESASLDEFGILRLSIENIGQNEITENYVVRFGYMETADPENPTELGSNQFNISEDLAPEAIYTLPLWAPTLPDGTDLVRVVLDADDQIAEDETNNTADLPVVAPPEEGNDSDIIVLGASLDRDAGMIDVTLRNIGSGDVAGNFISQIIFYDSFGENLQATDFTTLGGMPAGTQTPSSVFFGVLPNGASSITITADNSNSVPEVDESNNTFSLAIPPPPPVQTDSDIIVSSVTRDPVFGTIYVFVQNIGSEGISGAFTVELRFLNDNEELLGSMSSVVDELDVDQEKTAMGDFLPDLPEGTTVIMAVADSEDEILELDETNNTSVLTPLPPLPFLAEIEEGTGRDLVPAFDESVFRYTLAMGYEVDAIGFTLRTGNPVVDHFNVFNSQTQESVSLLVNDFGASVFDAPLLVGGNEFIITPRGADDEQLSADGYRLVVNRDGVPLTSVTSDLNGEIEAPFYSGVYTLTAPFEQSLATFTVESADPSLVFVEPFVNGQAVGVPPANLFAANEPFTVPLGVGNGFVSVLLRNADGAIIGNVGFDVLREPATLAGIGENLADELSPAFSPDERSYSISAVFAESEMTLTLEKEADSSLTSYEVFGDTFDINESATIPLQVGGNVVEIRLLSGAGYAGTYFLTVTRAEEVNESPTAQQSEFIVYGSRALGGQLFGFDPEGDALTFQIREFPLNGQLLFFNEEDGSFTYLPDDGFVGEDSFTFVVNDGRNDSAPAPVFLTINPAPVITSIEENLADDFDDFNLAFLNQIDAANEESQVTFRPEVSSDAVTVIAINANGNAPVLITPGEAATFDLSLFENSFVFTLFVGDVGVSEMIVSVDREGARLSNLAAENFELSPVFVPTTREYDIFNVPMNTDEVSILAESTDPLVTSVRVQGNDSPDPVFAPIGQLFQLPLPNFSEGFTVNLYDQDDQLLGSYSLTVTHALPPTLSNVTENLEAALNPPFNPEIYEYSLTARAGEDNVRLNLQSDRADEIANVRVTITQGADPAFVDDTIELNSDTGISLLPGLNQAAFELINANGNTFATYTFNITRNRAPTVQNTGLVMVQGGSVLSQVVAADSDNDDVSLRTTAMPTQGIVVFNPNGIFEYAPNADFAGEDSFAVRASDGIDDSEEATVSITVTPSVRMTSVGENLEADFDPAYDPASLENFISASAAESRVTFVPFMEDGIADMVVIQDEATETALASVSGEEATFNLSVGENIFIFTLSLNNTYVGSQRIIVNREQAMLSSLSENLSGDLTPEFDPSIRDYSLAALPENEEVRFLLESPVASFYQVVTQPGEAGQENDGPFDIAAEAVLPLEFEENTFRFDLLDENFDFIGSYTVVVNRPFKTLASLEETAANDLVPAFDPNVFGYTLTLGRNEVSPSFTFNVAEPNAETFNVVAVVNDFEVVELLRSGDSFTMEEFPLGETRLAIYILNDAGTLMGYYTVTINRPLSNVSTLASLTENTSADLNPAFAPAVTAYALNVDNATATISFTPMATDELATMTINTGAVLPGGNPAIFDLALGENVFRVVVTAEDGTTTTYTITVNRAEEGEAVFPPAPLPNGTSSPAGPSGTVQPPEPPKKVLGVKLTRLETLLKKLTLGSKGKNVKELQKLLKADGYLSKKFAVNGVYGKTTEKAVLKYLAKQKKKK